MDPGFVELVRLGVKSPTAADITHTISATDSELETTTPEGPIWHRYNFDGYGETSTGGDYTGTGVGNPVSSCLQSSTCPVTGTVKETVNVTVPVNTDASQETVYLDGNLSALGYGQSDWAFNGIAMRRVSSDVWTATLYATANATLSYKYDLGSWSTGEETSSCGTVANRTFGFNTADQTYTANDTVAAWEGVGSC